ncbi:MAG: hypothetical protein K0R69_2590, partial [Clostridia bacterium]|nr:hypothetical protein [Clostridia bacterium]
MKILKYYPELNEVTGSINATIVLLQLEYWFTKNAGNKFYKFLDACEHEHYKAGDSWVEELGFSKHEFRTAFSKIGKVYKSTKAFKASTDVFGDKYYASYYDRIKGLTYYIRNTAKLDELLNPSNKSTELSITSASKKQTSSQTKPALTNTKNEISANAKTSSPISIDYNNKITTIKNTYTLKDSVPFEMIKALFNQFCPSFPQLMFLTQKRKSLIEKLWIAMGQTIDHFQKAFSLAESSDFLSGRLGSWRASFDWLIQEDKFVALLESCYTNPNRRPEAIASPATRPHPNQKFTTMYTHNWDFEE